MYCEKCYEYNDDKSVVCTNCCAELNPERSHDVSYVRPKRGRKRFIIFLASVIIVLTAASIILLPMATVPVYGNTQGNIANFGCVAESGGWVYYNEYPGDGLYKMRPDGSGKTKLYDGYCSFINIYDGWIYFNNSDSNTLYKISTDGSGLIKLADSLNYICLENDWLFYISSKDGYIYKMRTDGGFKTKLSNCIVSDIIVMDGWIYYVIFDDGLYKISVDGTGESKLISGFILSINAAEGYVYFTTYANADNRKYLSKIYNLYKICTNGTSKVMLSDDLSCYNFNVSDGWIYYSYNKLSMHKMNTDGTNDIKLGDDYKSGLFLNIAGSWIYYYSNGFYRMKTDGTENQIIDSN